MAAAFVTCCAAFFKRGRTTTVIATLTTAATIAAAIFAATEAIIEVLRAVVVHGQRVGRVVGKVQFIAAPRQLHQLVAQIMVIIRRAVNGFRDALAVGIVAVGDIRPGLAHPRELAAVLPCVGPRAIAQKVADLVRRQALPADAREQVAPARVAVAIGDGAHRRAEISSRIGILRLALDVAAVIVGICPRLPSRLIVLAHELVKAVVGVGRRALAVGDEELQWYGATHHPILLQIPQLTSSAATAAVP